MFGRGRGCLFSFMTSTKRADQRRQGEHIEMTRRTDVALELSTKQLDVKTEVRGSPGTRKGCEPTKTKKRPTGRHRIKTSLARAQESLSRLELIHELGDGPSACLGIGKLIRKCRLVNMLCQVGKPFATQLISLWSLVGSTTKKWHSAQNHVGANRAYTHAWRK